MADIAIKGRWIRLCVCADNLLAEHAAELSEDDTAFLTMLSDRGIVWGTQRQVARINQITEKSNHDH